MKRTTIHISVALALLLGLAACTQDEAGFLPKGAEGTPIVFTAMGLNPAATATAGTRAPVDGNWDGVQSVAVLMGGTVKTYNVTPSTADPTSATLTSTAPHYWTTNHNDITVTAWWPYTAGETTPPAVKVKANQSAQKDFETSDLIVADGQTVTYGSPTLRFTHRTARVTIVLTDYTEESMVVQLTGLSTEGGNPAEITLYNKGGDTYTALVAPQSVAAGTTFITCTFTNAKTFVYKMKNAADWQAGGEYTYTVSLAAAKDPGYTIEDDGSYTVTSADGLMTVAELVNGGKTDINITLGENIDLTGKGWTPIGTNYEKRYKGTFDGRGHTIKGLTVTTNDQFVGLFGYLDKAGTVKNVVMEGIQITSNHVLMSGNTGGVVGYSWGTIENCSVSGSISGTVSVGGVVGAQIGGSIPGCSSSATVKGTLYVGGVAGWTNFGATLTACYATGNVIIEIAPTQNISGGGLVGFNDGISLLSCYATGNVTSTGSSTGYVHIGGFLGDNYTTVTACYWKNNHEQGIGYNRRSTKVTEVDGTSVTWQNAVDAMNTALQNKGSEWRYELKGALPTLRKQ